MESMKQIYLLLICQGFYLGSVGQRWTFPSTMMALIGSCVEIPCTYHPDRNSIKSSDVWLFPSRIKNYKDRFIHRQGEDCTLRIDPVREGDGGEYYPGISRATNAFTLHGRSLQLTVTDSVNIDLHMSKTLKEGESTTIRCTVIHTCGSRPPSLQWNKPGEVKKKSVDINEGSWREESELTYIPSYVDDGSSVGCSVTYPNGRIVSELGILNINYSPKNVTVTIIGMDEVMEGTNVTLQCNSFSRPDVHEYEWYEGKTRLPDRGREMTVYNVLGDMEPYSCTAINRVGRGESAPTEIPVLHAPTGVRVIVVNQSDLICDFLSSRPNVTHYTWMKNRTILYGTGKTLTLEDNEESSGQYSCIAHNRVGNSTSEEISIKRAANLTMDLPLILGTVAGVFLLLFFILVVYICLRRNKKSASATSPIHGAAYTRDGHNNTMAKEENHYDNIHHPQPPAMRSERSSVDVKVDENFVIYSNSEAMVQPSNEVEYSVIAHRQQGPGQLISSRAHNAEGVEYATLKR